ncbi:hypothetical protein ACJIZ3_022303 [Penstemon smallii]|uniref:Uncharacterized protein n=1 Tax=Penstemon smallii TaxID=265156 RepID=A0ABD3TMY9_9LAMI
MVWKSRHHAVKGLRNSSALNNFVQSMISNRSFQLRNMLSVHKTIYCSFSFYGRIFFIVIVKR